MDRNTKRFTKPKFSRSFADKTSRASLVEKEALEGPPPTAYNTRKIWSTTAGGIKMKQPVDIEVFKEHDTIPG